MSRCALALLLAVLLAAPSLATTPEAYADEILDSLQALVPLLPQYSATAELCARGMLAEGTLWLAGDRGFVLEGLNRAGGLMACKWLKKVEDVKPDDQVLYGITGRPQPEDLAFLDAVGRAGAHWFAFIPQAPTPGPRNILSVPAPPAADPQRLPTVSPILAASLWTFTAELVAALTREGKRPPLYQSVLVPGGRERNAAHLKLKWEPQAPPPVAPLVLGRTYLARVTNYWRALQATQLAGVREAGQMAAAAIHAGHTAWYGSLGHLPPELPGQTGDPGVLKPLKMNEPTRLGDFVKPGDVILYVGYYEPYGPWVERAHELGAKIVTVVSGTPERAAESMGADLNLCGCWPFGDAVLDLPGYDTKVLPPSGVIQSAVYWLLVAATAEAL
jgi:hypothetical protein